MTNTLAAAFCRLLGVAIALTAAAIPLPAQRDTAARATAPPAAGSGFIGMVVDSIHGGPLIGVEISVVGTERRSTSDNRGRFRIDSIPSGTYVLALSHPLFDTLGLSPATQPITVAPHRYVVVALATPSARTLRRQLCPGLDTAATPSFVMGRVRDADTGMPAAGAHVSMVYSATAVTLASGVRHDVRVRRVTAEADGTYVICGLESDMHGTLQVERAGVTTAAVETSLGGKVIALRSLSAGSGDIAAAPSTPGTPSIVSTPGDSARSAHFAGQVQRGRTSVKGFVFDSAGLPLAGAIVEVTSTAASTRTGSRGEFTLSELPSGTQELDVRDVGFDPVVLPVELVLRETRSVTVRLHRATPSLAPVVISKTSDAGLRRLGFFDRQQKLSSGYFITPAEVTQAQPRVVTDLMYLVPGWQVQTTSSGLTVLLPPRSAFAEGASACMNVFIDGALLTRLAPGEFDSAIAARDVVAMEVYSGASVPVEFAKAGGCVTIVVWTRARVGK